MSRPRVGIVQPYMHGFRVPFYERLRSDLTDRGIDLVVAHGSPAGEIAHRSDDTPLADAVRLSQRAFRLGPKTVVWRRLGELAHSCDALVLQHSLHTLESYAPLLRSRLRKGPPVALWGHGKAYTYRELPLAGSAKRAVTRRADWFFAYTESGRRDVVGWGFPAERTTVVRNSIDTRALQQARERVTDEAVARLAAEYGLTPGRTALYIGGLDTDKRIPYLLAAADRIAGALPGFRLLVAGEGTQRHLVERAAARGGAVTWVGRVDREQKALLAAAGDVLLMPGRVGLCAVDSFALGLPIVSTHWPYHSVEFAYLEHDRNAVVVADDEGTYAEAVTRLLQDPDRVARLRQGCRADAARYTVEDMSRRFCEGVEALLSRSS